MADDDDLDDFDLDEDDAPSGESGVPAPTDYDDDDDFDFDDDFDESGGGKGGKFADMLAGKKKMLVIAGSVVFGLAVAAGSYWYLFMTEEGQEGGELGNAVGMALEREQQKGLTPQQKLGAGAGAQLAIGGVTAGAKLSAGGGAAPKLGSPAAPGKLTTGGGKLSAAATMGAAATGGNMGGYDPENKEAPLSTAAVADVGINIPAVIPNAVAALGQPKQGQPLAPPNDPELFENTQAGKIPVVSEQGKEAWKSYARPFAGDAQAPVVGLIVSGLGMSEVLTQAAIDHLPSDVTLSFSAYGRDIKAWVEKARAMGHEVMLELPMEAESFPVDDPGPLAMVTSKGPKENLKILNTMMATAQGYVGFVGEFGSRFTKNKKSLSPVLGELKARGLMFVDPRTAEGSLTLEMSDEMQLPRAIVDTTLNSDASSAQLRAQLETLSTIAGSKGLALGKVKATPNTIKAVKEWAAKLQNVKISPISNLAGRQKS